MDNVNKSKLNGSTKSFEKVKYMSFVVNEKHENTLKQARLHGPTVT